MPGSDKPTGRMSPWTLKLMDLISWELQPIEPMVEAAVAIVPPGKALRKYQDNRRQYDQTHPAPLQRKRPLTDEEQRLSGARSLVRGSVSTLRAGGRIETVKVGDVEYVRYVNQVPDGEHCPTCGHVSMASAEDTASEVVVPFVDPHRPLETKPRRKFPAARATVIQFPSERRTASG